MLEAGPYGVIPKSDGYNGHQIKQADLSLAFQRLMQMGDFPDRKME